MDYESTSHPAAAFPIFAVSLFAAAFVAYAVCFVLAATTKRLTVVDYLAGTLGLFCGFGWMYFLYRANAVTLQQSFDIIEQGGDPSQARAVNTRFKIAAGLAIVLGIASFFVR
jgi:hypothetical protein